MTCSNSMLLLVVSAVGILASPAARGATVDSDSVSFVWAAAEGPVEGYGVWITWEGAAPGGEPDHIVTEPAVTVVGSPGQTLSIQVAAFDQGDNWGPFSPASDEVLLAPSPPVSALTVEGDLRLSDVLVDLAGTDVQLSIQTTGSAKQLLDVSPSDPVAPEDDRFGVDQLVVGAPGDPSTVRLLEAANLDLAQGVGEVYLFGLGYGEPCARTGEPGLRIHEGSTLILGGLDLYAFDGVECVHVNGLFPGPGDDPNVVAYDEGSILLYGDLDEDDVQDPDDNCLIAENTDQRDDDEDGYGTACDADYNQDGSVDAADFAIFRASYESREGSDRFRAALDHRKDGFIQLSDYAAFQRLHGSVPGPSGLSCAGTVPCY